MTKLALPKIRPFSSRADFWQLQFGNWQFGNLVSDHLVTKNLVTTIWLPSCRYQIVSYQIVGYQIVSYQIGVTKNPLDDEIWWYYIIELAFYWSLCISQFADVKRKVRFHTICPRTSALFYIVSYYIKWITTSSTYSTAIF